MLPLTAFLLAGCVLGPPLPPQIGQCIGLDVPTSTERPGMVLRRNANGQMFLAADLRPTDDGSFLIEAPAAQSLMISRTGTAAADLSFELLKALILDFSLTLSSSVRSNWTGTFIYTDLRELRTFDEPARSRARQWAQASGLQPGNRYFLIRDSRTARQVTMEITQQQALQLGLEAAMEQAASGSAGATLDKGATYRLSSAVEPPISVCHVLEEFDLIIPGAAPGSAGLSSSALRFVPVTDLQGLPPVVR